MRKAAEKTHQDEFSYWINRGDTYYGLFSLFKRMVQGLERQ